MRVMCIRAMHIQSRLYPAAYMSGGTGLFSMEGKVCDNNGGTRMVTGNACWVEEARSQKMEERVVYLHPSGNRGLNESERCTLNSEFSCL